MAAKLNSKTEDVTKKLITRLTGFVACDENFQICSDFVSSNFRYHRFLDVDSHKITRTLKGLHEKFTVNSEDEKAKSLKDLAYRFLEIPCFEEKMHGKTDTHYCILSMLLALGGSDKAGSFEPTRAATESLDNETPVDDSFDWAHYLLEGEEDFKSATLDEPMSDWSDEEIEPPPRSLSVKVPRDDSGIDIPSRGADDESSPTNVQVVSVKLAQVGIFGGVGVMQHARSTSQFCRVDDGSVRLSERQVVRETLWMLAGVTDLFVFHASEDGYTVNNSVLLGHLTKESIGNMLQTFTQYGAAVRRLQEFVDATVSAAAAMGGYCESTACLTHQAFSCALSQYLQQFRKELTKLETDLIKQELPSTLASLSQALSKSFGELMVLDQVYREAVLPCREGPNWLKASHLFGVLYRTLVRVDGLGGVMSQREVALVLWIFLETSRPYIEMIDSWISKGDLCDPYLEFIIQRNGNVGPQEQRFWQEAFTVYDSKVPPSSRGKYDWYCGAALLEPILKQVILAGKSVELLESLGHLQNISQCSGYEKNCSSSSSVGTIYQTFCQTVKSNCRGCDKQSADDCGAIKVSEDFNPSSLTSDVRKRNTECLDGSLERCLQQDSSIDSLLRHNFESVYNARKLPVVTTTQHLPEWLTDYQRNTLEPVGVLLQNALYPCIKEACHVVCRRLVDILKSEYSLLHYLSAMRKFFLLQAGDTMDDFYSELFDKMTSGENWRDVSFLNMLLHESLYSRYPEEVTRVTVDLEELDSKTERLPIYALNGLKLIYQLPWPVDVVIHDNCQTVYNQVFTFLLQIKRAKYSLDMLRFECLSSRSRFDGKSGEEEEELGAREMTTEAQQKQEQNLSHRMILFRMKLMHFVNSLHQYVMTRILHSTEQEFDQELREAADLEQIMAIHNTYVRRIYDRCLLHKKVAFIKEAVMKVLNLTLLFQHRWNAGVHKLSLSVIEDMEAEFGRCHTFLSSFLNNVVKRRSFVHLESFAFALISSNQM
ncbi:PREDICTED: gamma-tubulin complex component 5-like [Priapulus caudatus]|uniref:Gamma-tubulin complex component n=1 Tax=Priapulus caudatus TaxID=37621 RepID=A0ABM1FAY6_PRICU|nr:PREDICTED: gamma-tubulin complex component 5-like [Priapulus caudatus]